MSRTLTITFDGEVDGALTVTLNGEVGVASVGDPTSFISFINVGPQGPAGPAGTPAVQPTGTGIPHVVSGTTDAAASLIVNADVHASAAIAASKLAAGSSLQVLQTVAGVPTWSNLSPAVSLTWKNGATTAGNVFGSWADLQTALAALMAANVGRILVIVDGDVSIPGGVTFDCQRLVMFYAKDYHVVSWTFIDVADGSYIRNPLYLSDALVFRGTPTICEFMRFDTGNCETTINRYAGLKLLAGSTKSAVLVTGDYTRINVNECYFDNVAAPTIPLFKLDDVVTYIMSIFIYGNLSYIPVPAKVFSGGLSCYLDLYFDSSSVRPVAQTSFTGFQSTTQIDKNLATSTGLIKASAGILSATASTLVNADVSASAAISVSKLAAGSNGQVLTIVAGVPTWV